MDDSRTRAPHDGLIDVTGRPLVEEPTSVPDSALARVLRQVRADAMARSERQTVSSFNSAL
jgi:hypothetical protein